MNRLPKFRADEKMLLSLGQFCRDQLVPFVKVDSNNATRARVAVSFKGRLLDDPSPCHKGDVLALGEFLERKNRGDLFFGREIEEVDNGLAPGEAARLG